MTVTELLPPITAGLLFLVRCFEMAFRKGAVRGAILHRATWLAMLLSGTGIVGFALAEYFIVPRQFSWAFYITGLSVGLASFAMRAWAGRALGAYWSMHIELRQGHPLIKTGPYAYVRHPIYTAAGLELLGTILMLHAWWTSFAFILLFIPAIAWRIRLEERAMIAQLGGIYRDYINTTPALVPFWPRRNAGNT